MPGPTGRRAQILDEIAGIESMRRGTFNEVYRTQVLKSGAVATRGPFYNVTAKAKGNKTVTTAVPKTEAARVRREVEDYRRFRALCEEYIGICESSSPPLKDDSGT